MKIDKESIAKGFNLDPKTGEPLSKGEESGFDGMVSRLQKLRPDLKISKDDGSTKKTQQNVPGVSVKPGKLKETIKKVMLG